MKAINGFVASIKDTLRQLDEYWFGYGSPVSIGVMRILIGITTGLNLLITFGGFSDWYTERGYVPISAAARDPGPIGRNFVFFGHHDLPFTLPRFDLIANVTDTRVTLAFWIITLLACLTMTLGLWSRVSAIVLAICLVSLHHRNAFILHGGDTLERIAVLYMALAPCGKACSLDRLIGLYRGTIAPGDVKISLWPQRLITYNMALIYFTTVWLKWGGTLWRNGTATWYPARLNEFKRFWVPDFMNQMPFVKITTWGTLITELSLATLVFYKPLRKWVLLGGLMMHGFIEYSMNIPMFSFSICALYVTFFEGEEITGWARRWGGRLKRFALKVTLPLGVEFKPGPAAAFAAADPLGLVSYEPGTAETWQAVDAQEKSKNPFSASRARSLGGWIIALVPGLWRKMMIGGVQAISVPEIEPSQSRPAKMKARR
jgi:hypothetical protein